MLMYCFMPGVVTHLGGRGGRSLSVRASLVYKVNSRIDEALRQSNTALNKQKQTKDNYFMLFSLYLVSEHCHIFFH